MALITFTGTTTTGNATVASVSSTGHLLPGQTVTGAGIPSATTILTVGSGTITLSANATASATVTLTATLVGFTTVSASNLQDATGTLVQNATIYFQPVANNGAAISFKAGGVGGQVLCRPVQTVVVDGAFSVILADTTLTTPVNVGYSVTVIDALTGASVLGPGYACIQPSGATWSLDTYVPNLAAQLTVQVVSEGGGGAVGVFSETLTFSAAGSQTVTHGLETAAPIIQGSVTSGATRWSAVAVDLNNTTITAIAPMVVDLTFLGGIPASVSPAAPVVTLNPVAWSGSTGGTISFTATASGTPTPTVQWQTDTGTGGVTWSNIGGATLTTYSVTAAGQNGYQYRAVFSNSGGTAITSAATVAILANPVNSWLMTEGTGTTFADAYGSNPFTVPATNWGTWNSSYSTDLYNGTSSVAWVTNGIPTIQNASTPFSITAQIGFNGGGLSSAAQAIFSNVNPGATAGIRLGIPSGQPSNLVMSLYGTSGGVLSVQATGAVVAGVRSGFCISYDGSGTAAGMKIYQNGTLCTLVTLSDTLGAQSLAPPGGRTLTLGCDPAGGISPTFNENFTCMTIDHMAIWPNTLTQSEAAAIATATT
jgi:hypothetical protein